MLRGHRNMEVSNMKKHYGKILLILVILLAVYSVIVNNLNLERTTSFCTTYVMTALAILIQIGIVYLVFKTKAGTRYIYLQLPTVYVGGFHLFLQLVWSSIIMAGVTISTLLVLEVSVGLLALCLISVIITSIARI